MIKFTSKNIWKMYRKTSHWKDVNKSHENLFRLGVESIMIRGEQLLNAFFSHKSDANKYLMCEEQEDLMKEFGEWCLEIVYDKEIKDNKQKE